MALFTNTFGMLFKAGVNRKKKYSDFGKMKCS